MIIDIVRHGQTDWNLKGIRQWWKDIPLNSTWKKQAQKISERLKEESYDVVFVSGLSRAIETMEEIHKYHHKTPIIVDDRLNEKSCWDLEWSIETEINWDGIPWDRLEKCPPNGESILTHIKRSNDFLESIWNKGYKKILVVCHWGSIECIISIVNSQDISDIIPKNTAFYRVEKKWNSYNMLIENSDSHLT